MVFDLSSSDLKVTVQEVVKETGADSGGMAGESDRSAAAGQSGHGFFWGQCGDCYR